MRIYLTTLIQTDQKIPAKVHNFVVEADDVAHAVQRWNDFSIGLRYGTPSRTSLQSVGTAKSRGIEYEELF